MGDYNRDLKQENLIDNLLQEISGYTKKELWEEYEAACNLDISLPNAEPSSDAFENIWSRIQAERADSSDAGSMEESDESGHSKIIRARFGWKRLAAVGLIACLLAGSGCMVAMGTKSYFYRERTDGLLSDEVKLNNDMHIVSVNGEEEAYALIEEELGIKPLRLGFMPADMEFLDVKKDGGYFYMKFAYKEYLVYLIQSKYEKPVSYDYKTDLKIEERWNVYNKWLGEELSIKRETNAENKVTLETTIITDGACYSLVGTMDDKIFEKIVGELCF